MSRVIQPDSEDYAAIDANPEYAQYSEAEKHRLAQAAKMIRLQGWPVALGRRRGSAQATAEEVGPLRTRLNGVAEQRD